MWLYGMWVRGPFCKLVIRSQCFSEAVPHDCDLHMCFWVLPHSHPHQWDDMAEGLVAKSCPTLCNLMKCSTPGFPILQHLLEFTQTNVHWVGDAIQPSHPLSSSSPPTFNLSQHQGLFQGVSSSHQVTKVLELQLQHQSFQWIFRFDFLINLGEAFSLPPGKLGSDKTTAGYALV